MDLIERLKIAIKTSIESHPLTYPMSYIVELQLISPHKIYSVRLVLLHPSHFPAFSLLMLGQFQMIQISALF